MKRRFLVTALLGLLTACGSNADPPGGVDVAPLSVTPLAGPPGTPLAVVGLPPTDDPDGLRVYLGDRPTPFLMHDDGTLTSAVPIFGDGDWPLPPAEPQVLEVRRGAAVLGRGTEPVRVEDLPRAPGSARRIGDALTDIADGLEALLALLPETHPQGAPLRGAVAGLLRGLVDGGENSLQAVLDGTAPLLGDASADPALAEALLASSGAVAYYEARAAALGGATAALRTQALAGLCEEEGPDADLACLMQVQVVLRDYAEIVVKPTAYVYAHTVGLGAGYASVAAANLPGVAVAGLIGSLLGIADFVMNEVVPGLLPSRLGRFEMVLEDDVLDVGETTAPILTVDATNDPPAISVADLAELVLTTVGLKSLDDVEAVRAMVLELAKFYVDLFYKVLRAAEAASPGTFPDLNADHLSVPSMTWGPVRVTNERLVTLFSFDPGVVEPLPEGEGLAWRAVDLGETTVRAQTRGAGEAAQLLRDHVLCLGCVYRGGAFGLDAATAEAPVRVGSVLLTATPRTGAAPLATTFTWQELEPSDAPRTCTLDPGDGSDPITVADCAVTTGASHTYAATSHLRNAAGVYEAVLSVQGIGRVAVTEVNVGWTFGASPRQGDAPLDVGFTWSGLDGAAASLSCSLDPGDGTPVQDLGDCSTGAGAAHRYVAEGSYQATLFVEGGSYTDYRVVPITVGESTAACDYLADVEHGWVATYTMGHSDADGYTDTMGGVHEGSWDVRADVQVRYDVSMGFGGGSWRSADDEPVTGTIRVESQATETLTNGSTRSESVENATIAQDGYTYLEFDTEACTYEIDVRLGATAEWSATAFDGQTSSGTVDVSPGWLLLDPMPLPPSLDDFPLRGSTTVPARAQDMGGCSDCFLFLPGTTATYVVSFARDFPEWYGDAQVSWTIAPIEP